MKEWHREHDNHGTGADEAGAQNQGLFGAYCSSSTIITERKTMLVILKQESRHDLQADPTR
jgi:hypothetical protein